MHHRIRASTSLILFGVWAMTACASTSSLVLDTARQHDSTVYHEAVRALTQCKLSVLEISYAFGQVRLQSHTHGSLCRISVERRGELDEGASAQRFECEANVIAAIDWFRDQHGVRQQAPVLMQGHNDNCLLP